jgi:dedicated sortase system histidine kinase
MNLRRQLLLVSLLTLILPWAGCQFVRETESALREGQQQMLGGTAQAIADSLSQFPYELLTGDSPEGRVYAHPLASPPLLDGYPGDWGLPEGALVSIRGADGPVRYLFGQHRQHWYVYAEVRDVSPVNLDTGSRSRSFDHVDVISVGDDGQRTTYRFAAEAPGSIVARRLASGIDVAETRVVAHWQDLADGYSLEARIPRNLAGPRLGLSVFNTASALQTGITSRSFDGNLPGRAVTISPVLQSVAAGYVQPGWRLIITDRYGWRVATVGSVTSAGSSDADLPSGWMRLVYRLVLEPGAGSNLAEPAPAGRETQSYISEALKGETSSRWFRTPDTDRAVISVAQPIWSGTVQTGALILQHGTDAILSQANEALTRLIVLTLTATIVVAVVLLGYASWLSVRIRRLSEAAEHALDDKRLGSALPSSLAADEVGDLSRSFSSVLRQLGVYNDYLRSLAGKLSHELRTPLTIVKSSLENLEHEALPDEALEYTARAREGTERLQKILNAMSEASRTEQLIENAEPEDFALGEVIGSAVSAYADAWPERRFEFTDTSVGATLHGAPELVVQMLDKLVDNAIEFTNAGDAIGVAVGRKPGKIVISVTNPGPPLPDNMRGELFDSMVSVRNSDADRHLGLGLYIARIIAEGHNGSIEADNVEGGVRFTVTLPLRSADRN